jgi:hypothetical protein
MLSRVTSFTRGNEVHEDARGALVTEAEQAMRIEQEHAAQLDGHCQQAKPSVKV